MKNLFKVLFALCLVIGMVLAVCSCGEDETPPPSAQSSTVPSTSPSTTPSTPPSSTPSSAPADDNQPVNYTVNVVDALGSPKSGLIVGVFKDGELVNEKVAMGGTASFSLERGYYTFEITSMYDQVYYSQTDCYFDDEVTSRTVAIYDYADETNKQTIWIYDETARDHISYDAVSVNEGGAYVTIDRPAMSYFIFTPTRGGIYRFSYESSKALTIGYFGSPHNVLTICPLEVKDGAFELEIKNDGVNIGNEGGTTQIVIGIKSFTVNGCVLKIERVGDAQVDLPFTDVQADKNAVKVDNYVNSEFIDFDVTNSELKAVYNENDGYYHLNTVDGPVIYVRINTARIESSSETETIYTFLPSFVEMCGTDRLCKYFYEDGKVVLKESYNDMFYQYEKIAGTLGLYPLNEQLATAIKNIGEHKGWFDFDSEIHIFGEMVTSVVKENAWLFACVYENQQAIGNTERPAPVSVNKADSVSTQAVLLNQNTPVVLRVNTNATLSVLDAENVRIVLADGTEYEGDIQGNLSVVVTAPQNIQIIYEGSEDQTAVYFTLVEYFG